MYDNTMLENHPIVKIGFDKGNCPTKKKHFIPSAILNVM
jgi:hypothetical protein